MVCTERVYGACVRDVTSHLDMTRDYYSRSTRNNEPSAPLNSRLSY